jgi:hypothetical protein
MHTKRIVASGVAIAMLAVPGAALAASKVFRGGIDGDSQASLTLRITKAEGERQFKQLVVKDLRLACDGGTNARLRTASLAGLIPLDGRGRFRARAETDSQVVKATGRVRGQRARGTVRVFGSINIDGDPRDCDTGRVAWSAER